MFIKSMFIYICICVYVCLCICILVRNARGIKGRLKKNAESGAFTQRGGKRSFQRQCRPSLRTRVRKSRQLVKRLRSCCSLPPSRDVMLYLSRSNISCFAFHATLHNHKTLSVTKYMYTRKIIFYFNEIPYSSSPSPLPK